MNFKPKLVAFDLDGTLAESKRPITAEMGELLAELLRKMPVAIMSGASFEQFQTQLLPQMPETAHFEHLYLFPTNAAQCYIYRDHIWRVSYDRSFNAFEKGRIMQALKEVLAEAGLGDELAHPAEWGPRIEDRGAQIAFSALGQKAPIEQKQLWHDAHEPERKMLRESLARRLPDFSVLEGGLTTIDIMQKGVDKAYGIRKLVELANISVAEILYVGDALAEGGNDSVVINTGVHTHEVFGPDESAALIKNILQAVHLVSPPLSPEQH
ncbi:MAG TPA: HAD-IIB family hydrolase [Candidatus Paceibacterota bacterium]|nr:HAD-IIB family hydrolase [Candidatus Paceibacterota bacterium]